VDDTKLISGLDGILKQLQKISATIGISVGITDKGGKPKVKSTLDTSEKARTKAIAKETAEEYKKVLGLGFKKQDAKATAQEFDSVLKFTDYFNKSKISLDKIKDSIDNLVRVSNTSSYSAYFDSIKNALYVLIGKQKDYEPYLNRIETRLGTPVPQTDYGPILSSIDAKIGAPKPDYSPILSLLNVTLDSIKNAVERSVPKITDTLRTWDIFLRKMKWEDFRTSIIDYITRAEIHATNLNQQLTDLIQVNTDILNKKPAMSGGSTGGTLSKLGSIAGLMALGTGLILIVNALVNSNLINTENLVKVLGVIGVIVAMFVTVGLFASKMKDAAIGFGILSATIMFLVIPMIVGLASLGIVKITLGLFKLGAIMAGCLGVLKLMSMIKSSDVIENVKGFALFALTVGFLIIPLITHITSINIVQLIEGLMKLSLVFGACLLAMKGAERIKGSDVIKSMAGVLALSLMLKFLVIPMLLDMANLDWTILLSGLANVAIAIIGMGTIAYAIGKLAEKGGVNMLIGAATILALSFTVGYLGDSLSKIAGKDWEDIYKGLGLATLAITLFGLVVAGIGLLVANPLSVILLGAGSIAIIGLSFVAGYLADSLSKFSDKDWDEIIKGLRGSTIAMWEFGKTVAKMGALALISAPLLKIGAGYIVYLANAAGLVAVNLELFADKPWDNIILGLMGATIGMGMFGGVVAAMGAIVTTFGADVITTGARTVEYLSIIAGYLADHLMKFAYRPWNSITKGLTQATIAMSKFSLFVGGVGLFSKIIDKGIGVVYDISDLIGNIADNLMKYEDVDQINFEKIGSGLIFLGEGLRSMFFGSLSNLGSSMIDSITGFFNADPVSSIKKFESINSEKIYKLGLGLKFMGEGLRSLTTDMDLSNLIKDITLLTKPIIDLAYGISYFSDAYSKFDAIRTESDLSIIKNINVDNDNGIKDAIKESNQLQLDILTDQLIELRRNNQLLEVLINNGGGNNNNQENPSNIILGQSNKRNTVSSPSFETKDNYRNNLKLTSMSMQS